jgi:hypothetical protein
MRKSVTIVIDKEGRDHGKHFLLTEAPAMKVELWAARAFNGLARANVQIPEEVRGSGVVGVFIMGIKMLVAMEWDVQQGLMNEMLECARYMPDPMKPEVLRPLIGPGSNPDGDVEEFLTIVHLREEIFALHAGFTLAGVISTLPSAAKQAEAWLSTSTSPL